MKEKYSMAFTCRDYEGKGEATHVSQKDIIRARKIIEKECIVVEPHLSGFHNIELDIYATVAPLERANFIVIYERGSEIPHAIKIVSDIEKSLEILTMNHLDFRYDKSFLKKSR